MLYKIFFSTKLTDKQISIALLLFRLALAGMLFVHGWQKISNFSELKFTFLDPIGLGSQLSLMLAIFAEFFCCLGVMVGLFSRLSAFALVVNMFIITFVFHSGVAFGTTPFARELAYVYLVGFVFILITSPGKYSFDYFLGKRYIK